MDNLTQAINDYKTNTKDHTLKERLEYKTNNNDHYTHLTYSNPKNSNYHTSIMIYPGYLIMTGDMNEWVWSREKDMRPYFTSKVNPMVDFEKFARSFDYWYLNKKLVANHLPSTTWNKQQLKAYCVANYKEATDKRSWANALTIIRDNDDKETIMHEFQYHDNIPECLITDAPDCLELSYHYCWAVINVAYVLHLHSNPDLNAHAQ